MKNQQEKNNPIRTCIATGKKLPKIELLRIVSKDNGFVEYDITGKKPGRGANICMEKDVLEIAFKKNAFNRAFKRKLSDEEVKYLKDNFAAAVSEKQFRPTKNTKVSLRIKKEDLT